MIKTGVIGTGHLGKFHTKFFKENQKSELIGVFDLDGERAAEIAAEFETKSFQTVDELLENTEAVSIVTSTSSHYEIAKMALERGKHILIEKPITTTVDEANELIKIAKEKNLVLQVGHIERFNPAVVALDKMPLEPKFIQTDRLAPFSPRATDVAVVLDLMIHDIDIILSLIKSPIKNVSASGVDVVSENIDIANARLEFENGAVANVTASRISMKKMRKMRIFQKDAYISIDFGTGESEIYRLIDSEASGNGFSPLLEMGVGDKKKKIIFEKPKKIELNSLKHEIDLFIDCILNEEEPVVTGEDGMRALEVADIVIRKIEESRPK